MHEPLHLGAKAKSKSNCSNNTIAEVEGIASHLNAENPGVKVGHPAKLVFYRVTGFPGRDVHASIKIDGEQPVHKISNFHSWATDIAVGPHLIFGDDQRYGRTYMLEGGKTYYFRVDAIPPSMTKGIRFRVIKVPADLADAEMTGLDAD